MATGREAKGMGVSLVDRVIARRATRPRRAGALRVPLEPRSIGSPVTGRQILAGDWRFGQARVVLTPADAPWRDAPDARFAAALHGFGWLDDLAAVGDVEARRLAQGLFSDWLDRYGRGRGPGWTPAIAGRRLMAWLHHGSLLLRASDADRRARFVHAVGGQVRYLAGRAGAAPPGLPRIEALAAQLMGALAVDGLGRHADSARRALLGEAGSRINADGGIAARNPETLAEMFARLVWVRLALQQAGQGEDAMLQALLSRIGPVLRGLRHADGGLPRMQGGGAGREGHLDAALAEAGLTRRGAPTRAMGFARLARGRSTVIVDAAPPPRGRRHATAAHASTLAFDFTTGRRPVIVQCGSGVRWGADWARSGRETAAHSTLTLQDRPSARFVADPTGGRDRLIDGARTVPVQFTETRAGVQFEGGHDGYVARTGLTHARGLLLARDGRALRGEDYLVTLEDAHKRRFDAALAASPGGLAFAIRFHLHPDVDAALDADGGGVLLALRSGDRWRLRPEDPAEVQLEPSAYLDPGWPEPRATKQVLLAGVAMEYATRVRWVLEQVQGAGTAAIRDLVRDDGAVDDWQ